MKIIGVIAALVISAALHGQDFKGEASIPRVETDGFYRIDLNPALSAHTNITFSNIRIHDQQKKEVPYLFQQEALRYYTEAFKAYEVVEKKLEKNCCTVLTLRNPDSRPINNISLSIKNAEVTKRATLLGSDDRENWFALKQDFALYAINNQSKTSEIKIVDFPLSNYTFYQLQIEDSTSAPLNILSAGYYEQQSQEGKYAKLENLRVVISDSVKQKETYVQVIIDTTAHVVDRIAISMTGQPYFLRRATLYSKETRKNKRGETESFYEQIYHFEVSSKQVSFIDLPELKTKELMLRIENDDNPGLVVGSIEVFQRKRYLIAFLEKENEYSLKFGKEDLAAPRYDLTFFKDSIPNQTSLLSLGAITLFERSGAATSTTIFTNQLVIWLAIIGVVLLLGFMSVKLIREASVDKKN